MRSLVAADGTPADLIADVGADPNEVGRPRPGLVGETVRRTLFGSSGRAQAWDGGLRQSLERPLLGYGFGTEDRVFLDRFYVFVSARIENSYLGLWLQIGLVGLFVFLAVLAALAGRLARSWRDLRRSPGP
jgi:O-antigen ligase